MTLPHLRGGAGAPSAGSAPEVNEHLREQYRELTRHLPAPMATPSVGDWNPSDWGTWMLRPDPPSMPGVTLSPEQAAQAARSLGLEPLGVRLFEEKGQPYYSVLSRRPQGDVVRLLVDAGDGRFLATLPSGVYGSLGRKLFNEHEAEFYREISEPSRAIVDALRIRPGDRVAEIGISGCYLTIPLSKAVGPRGTVYAVDVEAEALGNLADRVLEKLQFGVDLSNVQPVHSTTDDVHLEPGSVDVAFVFRCPLSVETNEIADRCWRSIARSLAPGGRLVLCEQEEYVARELELSGVAVIRRHFARLLAPTGLELASWQDHVPGMKGYFLGTFKAAQGSL